MRTVLAAALLTTTAAGVAAAPAAEPLLDYSVQGDAVPAPLGGNRGEAQRGRAVVLDRRQGNCLICHRISTEDQPFQGNIGPSLDGIAVRLSPGQIRLRLIDQSRLNPATLMPPFYRLRGLVDVAPEYRGEPALSATQIEDVVAYLGTLTGPP